MGGVLIEANRWFVEGSTVWAALSATRSSPRIEIDSDTIFFSARGGLRLLGGASVTGGFRRASVDLHATLKLPALDRAIEGRTKPGIWDPLFIGVDWRRDLGTWTIDTNIQGGGFGVGADADISAEAHARWRVAKHLEFRAGYSYLFLKLTVADVSIGSFQRTVVASSRRMAQLASASCSKAIAVRRSVRALPWPPDWSGVACGRLGWRRTPRPRHRTG